MGLATRLQGWPSPPVSLHPVEIGVHMLKLAVGVLTVQIFTILYMSLESILCPRWGRTLPGPLLSGSLSLYSKSNIKINIILRDKLYTVKVWVLKLSRTAQS